MTGDRLTILRSLGLPLCKIWRSDNTIQPYSRAKQFNAEIESVSDIFELSALLEKLQRNPFACIIRGTTKADVPMPMRRLIENVDDIPLRTILIEVDDYAPVLNDPLTETQGSALEYITECLPPEFHDTSFHLQASNSMGAPSKEGLLKAHLWFWLDTPYDSATLRAWATDIKLKADKTVFNPVQVHYTASPQFEPGRVDPVPVRSVFHQGKRDSVDLRIDASALTIRAQGVRQRGERRDIEDPLADWLESHWDTHGELSNGGILASCPFSDEHSGGVDGDTSTIFFPAGSNGYSEGRWVCLHDGCRDRSQAEFNNACGYGDTRLAALAAPPPKINGHRAYNDPDILPPFKRNKQGILVGMYNLQLAATRPALVGMDLRMDTFREEIMVAPEGCTEWRPLTDDDYSDFRSALERTGFPPVGREIARDTVSWRAAQQRFDTADDWLKSVKWDGVKRIETFWIDHFGVPDDKPGYARAVGLYTWTALAGRVIQPGLQADMAPILTGPQGLGKSRGVLAMAPREEFATTMSFHEPEVERARKMRGTLVVELAELQGLKSRDREEILAWMTRSTEHWTPKFKEMSTTFRRRFVMFATTNDEDFLDDPTGERRWLPLACGRRQGFSGLVDIAAIERVRDQLWAEGRDRFVKGGLLWRDAERLAKAVHGDYKSDDVWRDALVRWLDAADMSGTTPRMKAGLTTFEIAEGALSMPVKQMRYGDQRRLAKLLKSEGFEQVVKRVGGRVARVWAPVGFV